MPAPATAGTRNAHHAASHWRGAVARNEPEGDRGRAGGRRSVTGRKADASGYRFFLSFTCVSADAATLLTFLVEFGLLRILDALVATAADVRSLRFFFMVHHL
jgi:hypothetical protein